MPTRLPLHPASIACGSGTSTCPRRWEFRGNSTTPDYLEALNRIVAAGKKHDRSLGRLVSSPQEGLQDIKQGFDFICYGTDTAIYQGALVHGISALRDAAKDG